MTKEQLVFLFNNLHSEDKNGDIEAVVHDVNGGTFVTDSIRLDMDGGRIIICQQNSPSYVINKRNWEQELAFVEEL
jgi:hypothetical protein|tara:strand:- start:1390 stop:1617 length:228 start_codon:yes stop_codon:yes gene_type:complete